MWVMDTDVVVAALRSRQGASAELVRLALRGEIMLGLSVAMVLEYEEVATRAEHVDASGLSVEEIVAVIDALVSVATPIEPHFLWRPQLRDADDEMVLEAAVNGGASAIVTFNRRDFELPARRFGVTVLAPGEALEMVK